MLLAGDIGGTKTVIALFEETAAGLRQLRDATFPSREHSSLEEILAIFLKDEAHGSLQVGCFGVAGPVIDGKSKTTNLPWELDETALAKATGTRRVRLLNDLEAAAYGMLHLNEDEFCVLNEGAKPARVGNIAVIAAGTGLGEAMLIWDGKQHHPVASEGGHTDFGPTNPEEVELLSFLREKFGPHVSYERILSGPGLFDLYIFLRQSSGTPEPSWLTKKITAGDSSAAIAEAGLSGEDAIAGRTLHMFASMYGAEAGNLALKCLAVGGVLIGGGIAPKMLPALRQGQFMQGFTAKGRYRGMMQRIPVKVALNPRAPLIGAAHYAFRLYASFGVMQTTNNRPAG